MTQSVRNFHAMTERLALSSLLPHQRYDREEELYQLTDGIGFIVEALPLSGAGMDTYNQMKSLFEIPFPADTVISFFLFADPNIRPILSRWGSRREGELNPDGNARGFGERDRRKHGIYAELARQRYQFVSQGVWDPLHPGLEMRFRNFRLVISCKLPGSNHPSVMKEKIKSLHQIRASILQQFKAMKIDSLPLDADGLMQILAFMLNPDHPERFRLRYCEQEEIRKQIIFSDSVLKVSDQFLKIDKSSVVLQTVKQYPDQMTLWDMVTLLGDPMSNSKQIPAPFISVMHAFFPDAVNKRKNLQATGTATTFQGQGKIAQFIPYLGIKKQNFDLILRDLDTGCRPVQVCHQLLVYGRGDKEAITASQAASALYQSRGFVLQSDQLIGVPLFINAMPLGFYVDRQDKLVRLNTMTSKRAASLVPIAAEYKGTRSPVLKYVSRTGQPVFLDYFDNERGNYNAVVAAASGAGKSYYINGVIASYRGSGTKISVIDVGRSYEALNELLEGEFIEFNEKKPISLNPFSHLTRIDSEEKQMLTPLFGQMASPSRMISDWEKNILERTISKVFDRMKQETTIDAIAAELEANPDQRGRDLGIQLYSYTSGGMRGKWFLGTNSLDLKNPLQVLELEELKMDPELQSVVLYFVLNSLGQAIYLGDRSVKHLVIIDEAWSLMGDGPAGAFIENAYRRFRKYGAGAITITQGINDFYKTAATRACLENSDTMNLLRQKAESLVALKESKRLVLSEYEFDLLASVHTQAGQYSEIFWASPMGRVLVRDYSDPFSYWVYTSTPHETALRKTFRQDFGPVETIQCCVLTQEHFKNAIRSGRSIGQAIDLCKEVIFREKKRIPRMPVPENIKKARAESNKAVGRD
ncbi:MAG: type IV secretion system protein TraC [Nitrospiria bacterium]